MVLFGFRRRSSRLATIFAMCGYCRTPSAHALTRRRRYFTLFFVPIIPMGAKHFTSCTMCGTTSRISKEASDHYLFLGWAAGRGLHGFAGYQFEGVPLPVLIRHGRPSARVEGWA